MIKFWMICMVYAAVFLIGITASFGNPLMVKPTTIYGKVVNTEVYSEKTIRIIARNIFEKQEENVVIIGENGIFELTLNLAFPQQLYLIYGAFSSFVLSPGDSLYMEIDADILNEPNNKFPRGHFFIQYQDSKLGKTNALINLFSEGLPNDQYIYGHHNDAVKNRNAEEFQQYVRQREKEYREFLKEFMNRHQTTPLFRVWVEDYLTYESMKDLMSYRWEHPYYNDQPISGFQLPDGYFSFLSGYDMDDRNMFSLAHSDFLYELSLYVTAFPQEVRTKILEEINSDWELRFKMIEYNTTGFTKELFLAKYYLQALEGHYVDDFEAIYDSAFSQEPYLINLVAEEYEATKTFLSNQDIGRANLADLNSSITNGLIDSIAEMYRNKVIYMDFWAPWCGPCMMEMPRSVLMQEQFEEKEVVFLFLGVQCSEESWKSTIANKKLTGEHVLLTQDQYNVLASRLGIGGIPHYTLIDKKGNIIFQNAPRPSEMEKLTDEINKLLLN